MTGNFTAGKSIPIVFGFGLIIILFGTLLLMIDPTFPGFLNVDYESGKLYGGQWFMLGGFAIWIIVFAVITIKKMSKKDVPVVPQTSRNIKPEQALDFFSKWASWNSIIVFGGVGLIGYVTSSFLPGFPIWAETIFGLMTWVGGALLLWRLFVR